MQYAPYGWSETADVRPRPITSEQLCDPCFMARYGLTRAELAPALNVLARAADLARATGSICTKCGRRAALIARSA